MSIHKKLNDARIKFHSLQLKKTGLNKFAGYDYFELGDFLVPALQTLAEFDLCAYISFGAELATMKIVDVTDGAVIEITSPMAEAALKGCHPIQNLGATQSYLRRYLWVAALEIVEHDAIDASSGAEKPKNTANQIKKDEFDSLPKDQQKAFSDTADKVRDQLDKGNVSAGYDIYFEFKESLNGDAGLQAALRSLFNSAEASALTKEYNKRKVA